MSRRPEHRSRLGGNNYVSEDGVIRMKRHIYVIAAITVGVFLGLGSVSEAAGPAANILTNFESNSLEGWMPRIGTETLAVTSAERHTGMYSLFTGGRTAPYDGCKVNVSSLMTAGSRYRITVWVKLAPGSANENIKVSLQRTLGVNTTYYTAIQPTSVSANGWTKVTGVYEYSLAHDSLFLYVESDLTTPSFYIDDFELSLLPPLQIQTEIPSLKTVLTPNFKIGAAVGPRALSGAHSQLMTKHFNSVTTEDAMKWGLIHPTEAVYDFAPADAIINFGVANGMQARGHTLVWHEQNPAWLFQDANGQPMTPTPANKALLLQRLDTHIRAVVGHFGNRVQSWDVVNEVIDQSQVDGFRRSLWFQICGTEYIDKAFQVARQAAPNAKLYINDYETTTPSKRAFLLALVRDLKNRGIPIDGVGHQLHSDIDSPTAGSVIETINLFSAIPGIDNQVTEMDVSIYDNWTQTYDIIPRAVLRKQGFHYRDLFGAFRQLQGKISSVTLWGLADDDTWLSNYPIPRLEAPLLFDDLLQAKPAYWGVVDPRRLLEAPFDLDGDQKTDVSIFRPDRGEWWYLRSSTGGNTALQFGSSTDKLVPVDYTGDGITDVAFWRPSTGQWFVLRSEDYSFFAFPFGTNGDIPVPADFDSDGKADAAVFRPSAATWFISRSTGGTQITAFGTSGDRPVPADFDGDSKSDLAIYRPNGPNGPNGAEWWIQRSSNLSVFAVQFGAAADRAAVGDYTGDGKADVAFWRPANGNWFVLRSEDLSFYSFPFGVNGDVPSPGDYDGDGMMDAAVFRPANSTWFVNRSTAGTLIQQFGINGDLPVPSAFLR